MLAAVHEWLDHNNLDDEQLLLEEIWPKYDQMFSDFSSRYKLDSDKPLKIWYVCNQKYDKVDKIKADPSNTTVTIDIYKMKSYI